MYPSKRVKNRTRSVTAKVAAEEEKRLKIRAEEAGLTLSEWARQVLLESVKASPEARLILAEFMALQTVLLVLHTDILQGRQLTEERIKLALEHADAAKFAVTEKRIIAFFAARSEGDNPTPP